MKSKHPLVASAPAVAVQRVVSQRPETCEWLRWESGQYETKCGTAFEFTFDDIKANSFKYCPFCGGVITEKLANKD